MKYSTQRKSHEEKYTKKSTQRKVHKEKYKKDSTWRKELQETEFKPKNCNCAAWGGEYEDGLVFLWKVIRWVILYSLVLDPS